MFDCNSPLISIFVFQVLNTMVDTPKKYLYNLETKPHKELPASKTLATNGEASEEPVIASQSSQTVNNEAPTTMVD